MTASNLSHTATFPKLLLEAMPQQSNNFYDRRKTGMQSSQYLYPTPTKIPENNEATLPNALRTRNATFNARITPNAHWQPTSDTPGRHSPQTNNFDDTRRQKCLPVTSRVHFFGLQTFPLGPPGGIARIWLRSSDRACARMSRISQRSNIPTSVVGKPWSP